MYRDPADQAGGTSAPKDSPSTIYGLPELALPQFVLAIAATTSFHIQIINRIASGYPIWYAMIAQWLVDQRPASQWVVRGIIVYAMVQGVLFANFLPPA